MSGKLFTYGIGPAPFAPGLWLLFTALVVGMTGACRDRRAVTRPTAAVDQAVRPERFAPAFRKLGRAHFRSVVRFEAGGNAGPMETVTTETDIWMDDQGNWRLVELNDKDGGREIVLHGRELAVALRYGKMIRRAAEDPEPQRLLEEGLGGPFAAWDLLRGVSTVDDFGTENRAGRTVHIHKLTKSPRPTEPVAVVDSADRRSWRRTVAAESVEGLVVVDEATGLPLQANFRAGYTMRRPTAASGTAGASGNGNQADTARDTGTPMRGAVDVRASIEEIGQSPLIARPEAEDLPLRQRTVPTEKALLGGLPRSAPTPPVKGAK
ncbi:MAG: hypothetical protein H7X95_10575 [Deltaproteobacteria bacterium]|nr:hypothetical protein [Deltaproteobacteria bacterium]